MHLRDLFQLCKKSFKAWGDDYAPSMGAAISYYTIFSIAPLLMIVIAVAGYLFGEKAVHGEVVEQLSDLMGPEAASAIQALLANASKPGEGLVASVIGTVVLIVGATTVFAELQSALDRIWGVAREEKRGGALATLWSRVLSFGLILGLAFLMMVSLVTSALLATLGDWIGAQLPGWQQVLPLLNYLISFSTLTLLFGLIYKFMPSTSIAWRDVWVGAAITSVLFQVGKSAISMYISSTGTAASFAAAGSLVVVLVWVYYAAQIFLLGAEFTKVYAQEYGSHKNKPQNSPGEAPIA